MLNAANEIAVDAFLKKKISFLSIHRIVEKTLNKASISDINSIKDVVEVDTESRRIATEFITKYRINFPFFTVPYPFTITLIVFVTTFSFCV